MTASPSATGLTTPEVSTFATAGFDDENWVCLVTSWFPTGDVSSAMNCCRDSGVRNSASGGRSVTVD
jgi:hypothetical protein